MLDIIFLFAAEFEEPKIGISGKGLSWDWSYLYYFTSIEKQVLTTYNSLSSLLPGSYTSTRAKYVGQCKFHSQETNSGPYYCKAGALPRDHRLYTILLTLYQTMKTFNAPVKTLWEK